MRAGPLDRRITIQNFESSESPSGEPIEVWSDLAIVWAGVTQQSGREFLGDAGIVSERKVVFRVRFIPDVTVQSRIIYETKIFNIEEVRELGRKEGFELHATAAAE